jgi:hypothetical protein
MKMRARVRRLVVFTKAAPLIALIGAVIACVPECGQRERLEKVRVNQLREAVLLFRKDNQRWPAGIDALIPRYMNEQPKDRWGRPFYLENRGGAMAVASAGPDGVFGTADDVIVAVLQ